MQLRPQAACRANKWLVNRVTPRCFEFWKQRLILEVGERCCEVTGSMAYCWRAKDLVLPEAFERKPRTGADQNLLL